ncbi:hypothetical protein [Aquiluna sp. Uisw_065]|uniref:hypothetical protein n=1 Tax=Aquiluna sp. Uisw_065 TaxID=3230967 RepID=UPI0039ECADC6
MKSKTLKALGKTRNVHLIDIENLCCESNSTLEHVKQAKAAYFEEVEPGENNLFFVTVSSKSNLEAAVFGWGQASFSCLEGHDGADILLAKMMTEDDLVNRFGKVYLASGDGGLAPFARSLIDSGVEVEIVAVPRTMFFQYRLLGAEVNYLWLEFELAA